MKNAKKFVRRICHYCSVRHPNYVDEDTTMSEMIYNEEKGSIRVLLSAFMISLHHGCVFLPPPYDSVQRDLISKSASLVERLERVALYLLEHQTFNRIPFELTCDFLPLLANFIGRFWAWSIPDKARLERSIQEELVELEDSLARAYINIAAADTDDNDDNNSKKKKKTEEEEVIENLNARIQQQRERLIQIAGRSALEKFDEVRMRFKRNAFNIMCLDPEMDDFHCPSAEGLAHELLLDPSFQFKEPENARDGDFIVKKSNIFRESSDKRVQVVLFLVVLVVNNYYYYNGLFICLTLALITTTTTTNAVCFEFFM